MFEESTTPDLLSAIRDGFDAVNRRDFDRALAPFSPEAVLELTRPGVGVFKGREAICAFVEDWIAAYEDYEVALEEFHDLGNDVTFLVAFQRARPTGSTGVLELRYATVSRWRDGLIERSRNYADIDEGRAATERLAERRG